eukprot:9939495-Heterocapsa_arctica.AAC.1
MASTPTPSSTGARFSVAELAGQHRGHQVASSIAPSGATSRLSAAEEIRARGSRLQEEIEAELRVLEMRARLIQHQV